MVIGHVFVCFVWSFRWLCHFPVLFVPHPNFMETYRIRTIPTTPFDSGMALAPLPGTLTQNTGACNNAIVKMPACRCVMETPPRWVSGRQANQSDAGKFSTQQFLRDSFKLIPWLLFLVLLYLRVAASVWKKSKEICSPVQPPAAWRIALAQTFAWVKA